MAATVGYVSWQRGKRNRVGHAYPSEGRPHVLVDGRCWCEPDLYRYCTQCDYDPACWACDGDGIIRIDEPTMGDPLLYVHHGISEDAEFIERDA